MSLLPFNAIRTQVAAQTGHDVYLVDVSDDILKKAESRIKTSLTRVAKKKFESDPKVTQTHTLTHTHTHTCMHECTHKHAYMHRCSPSHTHTHMQAGEEFVSSTLSRIQYSDDPVASGQRSDLVLEAIVENMTIKQELFGKLDRELPR